MTGSKPIADTIGPLEQEWERVCVELERHERELVETYVAFLRHAARTCLEKGCRVWFRPNRMWRICGRSSMTLLFGTHRRNRACDIAERTYGDRPYDRTCSCDTH